VAQPTAQLTWIWLLEARELVTRRFLSLSLAKKLLVEWLNDKNKPVRWRYEYIENNSGVSTETALNGFWRSAAINWEENSAARKVEPPTVARAQGGVAPGGVVWRLHNPRPTPPSAPQLGDNFVVYGIRFAREDVEARLVGYVEPVELQSAESPPLPATDLLPPAKDEKCLEWLGRAIPRHQQKPDEIDAAYHRRLRKLSEQAWSESHIKNSLDKHRRGSPIGDEATDRRKG